MINTLITPVRKAISKRTALIILGLLGCLACANSHAEEQFELGDHTLYYTLFNSTFVPADIARAYQLKRSKYEWLLNVVVSKNGEHGGVPVKLSGLTANLMGQQKRLKFNEIKETGTVYFLAPIRVSGEDVLHFELQVTLPGETEAHTIKFTDKVISD